MTAALRKFTETEIEEAKRRSSLVSLVERVRELFVYDPGTGIFTRRVTYRQFKAGAVAGCDMGNGYLAIMVDGVRYKAHRLAWLYVHDRWPVADLDHRNRQKADNRLVNLREASRSENVMNAPARSDNRSGVRGVSFHGATGKWQATLVVRGCRLHLGLHKSRDAAAAVYAEAAREHYGEFVA